MSLDPSQALFLAIPAVYAVNALYGAVRTALSVGPLSPTAREPGSWPKISIVVPACNEEDGLEAATRAKLASDYPNLEIVLVDDRSSDRTGAIADALAEQDPRVVAMHVRELPSGWLGKLHALHVGARAATGEWLLFSDADAHIAPGVLRRVIAMAEAKQIDFVTTMPHIWSSGLLLDAALTSFLRILVALSRLWAVSDPKSRAAVGGGMFNLARRAAYERTRGFEWLRLEVGDDAAFGQMMKRSGARCAIFNAKDEVGLYFYRSVGELARGFEKSFGGLPLAVILPIWALLTYAELAPLFALASSSLELRIASASILGVVALSQIVVARWCGRPIASAALPCLGPVLLLAVVLRSLVLAHVRGVIDWRGTRYTLRELRAGRRISL
jgi:hypothetical protein